MIRKGSPVLFNLFMRLNDDLFDSIHFNCGLPLEEIEQSYLEFREKIPQIYAAQGEVSFRSILMELPDNPWSAVLSKHICACANKAPIAVIGLAIFERQLRVGAPSMTM